MGALRAGAGLISLGVPKSLYPVMALKLTEVMTKPLPETRQGTLSLAARPEIENYLKGTDVLAMGPGLSQNPETERLIRRVALGWRKCLVLDADGLNAFRGKQKLLGKLGARAVLTPHPGEAGRLSRDPVPRDDAGRKRFALAFAKRHGVVLVLKGHRTVVASPDGKVYVNRTGNPGLATGGSGDVLTGIVAAFLAQGLNPFAAARCAVYIHGLAGDLAVKNYGEISLVPTDVLHSLPRVFLSLLGR
jgi:NAD(P)H-hydrate epimerase